MEYLSIDDITLKTGISKSRIRYIEARFPSLIHRQLFSHQGSFYSSKNLQIIKHLNTLITANDPSLEEIEKKSLSTKKGKILTFASGKGGVGKTTLSVNLSLLLAKQKKKVVLIDGDLGMANAHVYLGMRSNHNLASLFSKGESLKDILSETPYGFQFLSSGGGDYDLANLGEHHLDLLGQEMIHLKKEKDFLIIDSPAGLGKTVFSWIGAANELIVITTPSKTALLDAYGLIKVSREKNFSGPIRMIINMVNSEEQGKAIFTHLHECSSRFLQCPLSFLGTVLKDEDFESALKTSRPFASMPHRSRTIQNLENLCQQLIHPSQEPDHDENKILNPLKKGTFPHE